MNRDEMIQMAERAGFYFYDAGHAPILHTRPGEYSEKCFERFAHKIIADFLARTGQYVTNDASREAALEQARAEEREACLRCYSPDDTAEDWADKIRARGQQ